MMNRFHGGDQPRPTASHFESIVAMKDVATVESGAAAEVPQASETEYTRGPVEAPTRFSSYA